MILIGLTGGIATGKSAVSKALRVRGIPVIDGDIVAREIVEKGQPALKKIKEAFGPAILRADGTLDRQKLGKIIFQEPHQRYVLNGIMRPYLQDTFRKKIAEVEKTGTFAAVLDIPLLFEEGYHQWVDVIMVVYAPVEVQRARLMNRDHLDKAEADRRIRAQMPVSRKAQLADVVIDNSGRPETTERQIDRWVKRYLDKKRQQPNKE